VVAAVADPYTGWRDDTALPRPLDYRPLSDFIERWPDFVTALNAELRPGHPACTIRAEEVDEAVRGLASPHVIVRRPAVDVLGEHRLGPDVAVRVLPLLHDLAEHDPDADVRRLSNLSAERLRGRNIA